MKQSDLVTIILDLHFALIAINSFIANQQHPYSGKKNKVIYSDTEKLKMIRSYIANKKYGTNLKAHSKFRLDRINDKLFSSEEIEKGYHRIKRTNPLNKMANIEKMYL